MTITPEEFVRRLEDLGVRPADAARELGISLSDARFSERMASLAQDLVREGRISIDQMSRLLADLDVDASHHATILFGGEPDPDRDTQVSSKFSQTQGKAAGNDGPLPKIEGYELVEELGRGSMGVVYKARQIKLNRLVALKMILTGVHSSGEAMARFVREAESAARLQHPNIVQVFDIGERDGLPFFSIEYVDGGSLEDWIKEGSHSFDDSAEVVRTLAQAMQFAHERGIVHRDLKPANVLRTYNGTLKIGDFGLAKQMEGSEYHTRSGSVLGTPAYMSPEQAMGRTREIGPATDVYALGTILYELLTGRPPFRGETLLETLDDIRTKEPVDPRRIRPGVPRDLETICLHCLRKNPRDRYSSAADLSADLDRYLKREPIHARPVPPWEKLHHWLCRRKLAATIATVVLTAMLAIGWLTTQFRQQAEEFRRQQDEQLAEARRRQSEQERLARKLEAMRAYSIAVPMGLPPLAIPVGDPMTVGKVELGRDLFFDRRLSVDDSVSCASCHDPKLGFGNGEATAVGVGGKRGHRRAPTLANAAYNRFQFWDGRAETLEQQALAPIYNPIELGMPSVDDLVEKLSAIEEYKEKFRNAFDEPISEENIAKAIAAFERTILSGCAPYDFYQIGETSILSAPARRGMELFFGKAHCSACHSGPNFTDNAFHNVGIGVVDGAPADPGREAVSGLLGDRGSFKTPTLRDVGRRSPYMHDGSLKTLEEVVDHYVRGGVANPQLDEEIYPLQLNDQDKKDLVAFLREGLTSSETPASLSP